MQAKTTVTEFSEFDYDGISVNDFEVGPAIAKGSNAVVYAARKKSFSG